MSQQGYPGYPGTGQQQGWPGGGQAQAPGWGGMPPNQQRPPAPGMNMNPYGQQIGAGGVLGQPAQTPGMGVGGFAMPGPYGMPMNFQQQMMVSPGMNPAAGVVPGMPMMGGFPMPGMPVNMPVPGLPGVPVVPGVPVAPAGPMSEEDKRKFEAQKKAMQEQKKKMLFEQNKLRIQASGVQAKTNPLDDQFGRKDSIGNLSGPGPANPGSGQIRPAQYGPGQMGSIGAQPSGWGMPGAGGPGQGGALARPGSAGFMPQQPPPGMGSMMAPGSFHRQGTTPDTSGMSAFGSTPQRDQSNYSIHGQGSNSSIAGGSPLVNNQGVPVGTIAGGIARVGSMETHGSTGVTPLPGMTSGSGQFPVTPDSSFDPFGGVGGGGGASRPAGVGVPPNQNAPLAGSANQNTALKGFGSSPSHPSQQPQQLPAGVPAQSSDGWGDFGFGTPQTQSLGGKTSLFGDFSDKTPTEDGLQPFPSSGFGEFAVGEGGGQSDFDGVRSFNDSSSQQSQSQNANDDFGFFGGEQQGGTPAQPPKQAIDTLMEHMTDITSGTKKVQKQSFKPTPQRKVISSQVQYHEQSRSAVNWSSLSSDVSNLFKTPEQIEKEREMAELMAKRELEARDMAMKAALAQGVQNYFSAAAPTAAAAPQATTPGVAGAGAFSTNQNAASGDGGWANFDDFKSAEGGGGDDDFGDFEEPPSTTSGGVSDEFPAPLASLDTRTIHHHKSSRRSSGDSGKGKHDKHASKTGTKLVLKMSQPDKHEEQDGSSTAAPTPSFPVPTPPTLHLQSQESPARPPVEVNRSRRPVDEFFEAFAPHVEARSAPTFPPTTTTPPEAPRSTTPPIATTLTSAPVPVGGTDVSTSSPPRARKKSGAKTVGRSHSGSGTSARKTSGTHTAALKEINFAAFGALPSSLPKKASLSGVDLASKLSEFSESATVAPVSSSSVGDAKPKEGEQQSAQKTESVDVQKSWADFGDFADAPAAPPTATDDDFDYFLATAKPISVQPKAEATASKQPSLAVSKEKEFVPAGNINLENAWSGFMSDLQEASKKLGASQPNSPTLSTPAPPPVTQKPAVVEEVKPPTPPTDGDIYSIFKDLGPAVKGDGHEDTHTSHSTHDHEDENDGGLSRQRQTWVDALSRCLILMTRTMRTLEHISKNASPTVLEKVFATAQVKDHMAAIMELYLLACRISCSAAQPLSEVQGMVGDIRTAWTKIRPHVYKAGMLPPDEPIKDYTEHPTEDLCGLCLVCVPPQPLSQDSTAENPASSDQGENEIAGEEEESKLGGSVSESANSKKDRYRGNGGVVCVDGRRYHAPCANMWSHEVQGPLPALAPLPSSMLI